MWVVTHIDWVAGGLSVYSTWLTYCQKSKWSVHYCLVLQLVWVAYAVVRQEYGLMPLTVANTAVLTRALCHGRMKGLVERVDDESDSVDGYGDNGVRAD